MWSTRSLQRHLCVLFLTSVAISSWYMLKKPTPLSDGEAIKNTTESAQFEQISPGGGHGRREIIHILGLFELTTKWGDRPEGLSEIAAARLAIEHVNKFNILPDYELELITNDTRCDPGVGIDRFFHAVYSRRRIVMLLGTSCSNVTESLAHVVPYWNILQISFGSTSPALSDRNKFPLFFRTVAPDSSHNAAKVKFVKYFGWQVVATFSQSENEYILPLNRLISDFENENITCVTTVTFSLDNYKEQLKTLKDSDIRIIVAAMSVEVAPTIFCEAYDLDMFGTSYVWIMQDRHETWWRRSPKKCSFLELAVEGVFFVSDYNVVSDNASVSGLDSQRFEAALGFTGNKISKYASLAYDAVWAMALSLRDVYPIFAQEFNRRKSDGVCEFVKRMESLSFMGVSGPLRFIGADRVGSSILRQLQNGRIRDIALFDPDVDVLDFGCKSCRSVNWRRDQTPIARRILKVSLVVVPDSLLYAVAFVAIVGVSFSLFFLYFNLHFRRMKTMKLSSPKLNNVAVVGCVLVYVSVALLGFDTSAMNKYVDELCTVRVYLLSSGFTLAFGSMFAKTYRVHRIFTAPNAAKDKLLKDNQLIALIFVPLAIDVIILTLWVMIDPMERQLYNLTLEINSEHRGVVYQPQVVVCKSHNTTGWFVAIYGYKGLLLIMGVFMAWETRHIKVQALNDSQYIGICVYSAVFSAIIIVLTSFTSDYVIISYLARTVSVLTSTSLTLFLLFLPKLKSVFGRRCSQDPVMQSMGLKMESNTRRFIVDDPKEQIHRLEIQNKVFRSEMAKLDSEISRLEGLLRDEIFTVCPAGPSSECKKFSFEGRPQQRKSLIDEMKQLFQSTKISPKSRTQTKAEVGVEDESRREFCKADRSDVELSAI